MPHEGAAFPSSCSRSSAAPPSSASATTVRSYLTCANRAPSSRTPTSVLFCFREEYHKRDVESLRGQAELIIGKQRNGPTATVNLFFRHEFTRFENRTGDVEDAGYAGPDSGPIDLGDPF